MEDIKIVQFIDEHASAVKELVVTIHEEFGFSYDRKLDYDLDNIKEEYIQSGGGFWVALHNRKIIGCIAIKKNESRVAELKRMYLYPEYRKKGIGQRLLNVAIIDAISKDYNRIILDTTEKQKAAIEFYEKNGFSIMKRMGSALFYYKDI